MFITRGEGAAAELLTFEHPHAGTQVPAGTGEVGETPEQAALREAAEETGLRSLRILAYLGRELVVLPEGIAAVLRATKLFDQPAPDSSSERGYFLPRGTPVAILGEESGYAAVSCQPLDMAASPPVRVQDARGFVRASILTRRLERHFYHLTADEETPPSWQVATDGHLFRLAWRPLRPAPALYRIQAPWLERFAERLAGQAPADQGEAPLEGADA
jgi:8-oxo-dGTP pyrophosphatase MutT (NUDIX family)